MKPKLQRNPQVALRSGFTLVELMVVIVVILASLVFLGTNRLRRATAQATSADNLRKLQVANGLYASDNNGRFVATYGLQEALLGSHQGV